LIVTGSGLITSLGAGKADNRKQLTAGVKAISRLFTGGLKTKIAGTIVPLLIA
jgi:3-oxoacyl-[acyl-carrier-protein] synthase II